MSVREAFCSKTMLYSYRIFTFALLFPLFQVISAQETCSGLMSDGLTIGRYSGHYINDQNELFFWGSDKGYGISGTGLGSSNDPYPMTKVTGGFVKPVKVSAEIYSVAVLDGYDNSLWVVGSNSYGELGLDHSTTILSFTKVEGLTDVVDVFTGYNFIIVQRSSAPYLVCSGANDVGQCGTGNSADSKYQTFTSVSGVFASSPPDIVSVGSYHACAREASTGNVYCWGQNTYGHLGDGTTTNRYSPTLISGAGPSITGITCTIRNTCFLYSTGQVSCVGYDVYGLASGASSSTPKSTHSIASFYSSDNKEISLDTQDSLALLKTNGTLYITGPNTNGRFGVGNDIFTIIGTLVKAPIQGNTTINYAGNFYNTCYHADGNKIYCSGRTDYGVPVIESTSSGTQVTPSAVTSTDVELVCGITSILTEEPTSSPTKEPTLSPTEEPTSNPTEAPTSSPTKEPTLSPTEEPTSSPTKEPTLSPTEEPTSNPTEEPTSNPTEEPTSSPTKEPTLLPTEEPTSNPTEEPTSSPTKEPTLLPTEEPTSNPTEEPTSSPTKEPTLLPTEEPTSSPTKEPTLLPTEAPTSNPTGAPTSSPTKEPTLLPTEEPTSSPTKEPTLLPTEAPTSNPTGAPTSNPTKEPTFSPTEEPTFNPTEEPTSSPTKEPTLSPTEEPTLNPTGAPSTQETCSGLMSDGFTIGRYSGHYINDQNELFFWGVDFNYGISGTGLGSANDPYPMTKVTGGFVKPVKVSIVDTSVAVLDGYDNSVWVAGGNYHGELGLGHLNVIKSFTKVEGLTDVVDVFAGSNFIIVQRSSAPYLVCAGRNIEGQCGTGNSDDSNYQTFTSVSGVFASSPPDIVSVGDYHACAREAATEQVYCWGQNTYKCLGDGTSTTRYSPTLISGAGPSITGITCGTWNTCFLYSTGQVSCVGYDYYGLASGTSSSTPKGTHSIASFYSSDNKEISMSNARSLALLKTNGKLYFTGQNNYGRFGIGVTNNIIGLLIEAPIQGNTTINYASSYNNICVHPDGNKIYCSGMSSYGVPVIGSTSSESQLTPLAVTSTDVELVCSISSSLTEEPTTSPTKEPTLSPTEEPTFNPTEEPTSSPTKEPTLSPTEKPTFNPTEEPTSSPTKEPTLSPTEEPTSSPTKEPTLSPTEVPTSSPTKEPTFNPTEEPTSSPTKEPTLSPTEVPTSSPTKEPTLSPTKNPTTKSPTAEPTKRPTLADQLGIRGDPCNSEKLCEEELVCSNITSRCTTPVTKCTLHSDCFISRVPGFLPQCNKDLGLCVYTKYSSCNSEITCNSEALSLEEVVNSQIVDIEISGGGENLKNVTAELLETLNSNLASKVNNSVTTWVSGSESLFLELSLPNGQVESFNLFIGNLTKYLVCGLAYDQCDVQVVIETKSSRRLAENVEDITITVSYEIDEETYDLLMNTGSDMSSLRFINLLASELNTLGIFITVNEYVAGKFAIEVLITESSDMLYSTAMRTIATVISTIDETIQEIQTSTNASFYQRTIDQCPSEKTCFYRGTCNSTTGICECEEDFEGLLCGVYVGDEIADTYVFGNSTLMTVQDAYVNENISFGGLASSDLERVYYYTNDFNGTILNSCSQPTYDGDRHPLIFAMTLVTSNTGTCVLTPFNESRYTFLCCYVKDFGMLPMYQNLEAEVPDNEATFFYSIDSDGNSAQNSETFYPTPKPTSTTNAPSPITVGTNAPSSSSSSSDSEASSKLTRIVIIAAGGVVGVVVIALILRCILSSKKSFSTMSTGGRVVGDIPSRRGG